MKRKIELSFSLAQALKRFGVRVTAAEEKEEQSIIKAKAVHLAPKAVPQDSAVDAPPFWPKLLERLQRKSVFAHTYFREANYVRHAGNVVTIQFPIENNGIVGLVDNARNRT